MWPLPIRLRWSAFWLTRSAAGSAGSPRAPSPIPPKAGAMPADNRLVVTTTKGLRQPDHSRRSATPEQPIEGAAPRTRPLTCKASNCCRNAASIRTRSARASAASAQAWQPSHWRKTMKVQLVKIAGVHNFGESQLARSARPRSASAVAASRVKLEKFAFEGLSVSSKSWSVARG